MELTRKAISLFPSQHGFLFLGILTAMLLGSVNYNNNAGFILVFLLGSMALISLVLSYRNLLGLKVVQGQPLPVFKGQTGRFPMEIQAPNPRGQALSLYFPETPKEARPVSGGGGGGRIDLPFETRARGYHIPGTIRIESVFPFGLFRLRAEIPNTAGILVYPEPAEGGTRPDHSGTRPDGDESSRLPGPDDFQGLAPYVPGSPVRHISWKALSRGQGLFIKEFTAETGQETLFDLDKTRGRDLEEKLSLLCSALLAAEKLGRRYGLRLGDSWQSKPDSGTSHLHTCLSALALYREAS